MRQKSKQQIYVLTLTYPNNMTRRVRVKAASREAAENRALKRYPNATGVMK